MKKATVIPALLMALVLCFGVACGGTPASSSAAPPASSAPVESTVEGKVADATMNTLQIETDLGTVYLFATDDDTVVDSADGILIGDTVVVHYTGTLDEGAEVQPVTVTKVSVTKLAEETVEGYITDATMNTLQIKTAEGARYLFGTMDAEIDAGSVGILIGDAVTVAYTGTLDPNTTDMQPVTVVKVTVTQQPESSVSGKVTDASMNSLEIRLDGGSLYRFTTTGATIKTGANGLIVGDEVRIYFLGTFDEKVEDQNVTVERVVVTAEAPPPAPPASTPAPAASSKPAPAASSSSQPAASSAGGDPTQTLPPPPQQTQHMVSGTLTDMTNATLTIEAENGTSLLFGTEDAEMDGGTGGFVDGDAVTVFYYGTLAADGSLEPVSVVKVAVTGWGGNSLTGTVADATMNAVTLLLTDGTTTTFGIEDADVEGGPSGITLGAGAEVHFLGSYVAGQQVQDVTVVQLILH